MTSSGYGVTPSGTNWVRSLRLFARALAHASSLAGTVAGTLLAPECLSCGIPLSGIAGGPVCGPCWTRLSPLPAQQCGACGATLGQTPTDPRLRCSGCHSRLGALTSVTAWGRYDGTLRTLIHAMKYDGYASIASRLGVLIRPGVRETLAGAHAAVPVPLHPVKRLQRGFNQADLIARGLGLPVIRVLRRRRWTHSQTRLRAGGRQRNVENAFRLAFGRRSAVSTRVQDRVLVLVDDVRTTGATLEACAAVLRRAGAAEVRALVVARADLPRHHGHAER